MTSFFYIEVSASETELEGYKKDPCGLQWSHIHFSACSCGGFLFARQAPSGGGYAGFVTGRRTKMAGKVL